VQEQSSGGGVTANLLDGLNIDEFFMRIGLRACVLVRVDGHIVGPAGELEARRLE
jgi:hypothetical protein